MVLEQMSISKITLRDIDLKHGELTVRTLKLILERTIKLTREVFHLVRDRVSLNQIDNLHSILFAALETTRKTWMY
jgi:hypothetical protein